MLTVVRPGGSTGGTIRGMENLVDDGGWSYLYDERDRLVEATLKNASGVERVRYSYAYDDGDNLLVKKRIIPESVFSDSFSDGNYTASPAWTVSSGTWSAASQYLEETGSGAAKIEYAHSNVDQDVFFSYYSGDTSNNAYELKVYPLYQDANNSVVLRLAPNQAQLQYTSGGSVVGTATASTVTTAQAQWYDVYVQRNDHNVRVWRGKQGEKMTLVLELYAALATNSKLIFESAASAVHRLDDIRLCKHRALSGVLFDGFGDGNLTIPAWTQTTGTWDVTNGYATNSVLGSRSELTHAIANGDGEYFWSYSLAGTGGYSRARLNFRLDTAANDWVFVAFDGAQATLNEVDNGVAKATPLDVDSTVTSTNTDWYDVHVKAVGAKVEVWRAKRGDAWAKVLDCTNASILSGNKLSVDAFANTTPQYDEVSFQAQFAGRSFDDNFTDLNYTATPAWTTFGGSWSATSGDMANTVYASGMSGFYKSVTDDDFDLSFTYTSSDTSSSAYYAWVDFRRTNDNNRYILAVENTGLKIIKVDNGSWSTPVSNYTLTTTQGQAYDVQMIVDGKHVEVWRGLAGQEKSLLFTWDDATLFSSGNRLTFRISANARYRFDNIAFTTADPQKAGHGYNGANELTLAQDNGRITRYTYDDWGRTVATRSGKDGFDYLYRFGNYLKRADRIADAALKERVYYVNDGLGRRRLRQVASVSGGVETTTDNKLYRWAGLEEIGEYQAGTTNWYDAGAKTRSYLPGLAEVSGSDQSTGAYRHYLNDHLGTPRRMLDSTKTLLAKHSYSPYGDLLSNAGLPIHVGYTGHTWDSVTSQWFAPYRYYSPNTARWGWRDPLPFADGPNQFHYLYTPTSKIDQDGRIPLETIWDVCVVVYDAVTLNWTDLAIDTTLMFTPYVPAGLSKIDDLGDLFRHLTKDVDAVFKHLEKYHGIDPRDASDRLHKLKEQFENNPDVLFDWTGNVYTPKGECIGSLTQGGGSGRR